MNRFLLTAVLAGTAALYFTGNEQALLDFAEKQPTPAVSTTQDINTDAVSLSSPGKEQIKAGKDGHFVAIFEVNGRDIEGLVDTGATFVAINESTARRIGISGSDMDFRYAVTTANGTTQAAHIVLKRLEFGSIKVRDVEAFVLKDKALSGMLVGMSFMKRLKSYQVENDTLYLKN
jgi:aspartyl protease family protein